LTKGGMYLTYGDLMFLLSNEDFHQLLEECWSFQPLTSDYTIRLERVLKNRADIVGEAVDEDEDEEEEEEEGEKKEGNKRRKRGGRQNKRSVKAKVVKDEEANKENKKPKENSN